MSAVHPLQGQLQTVVCKLSEKDQAFANSLCAAKNLSERQLYWINVLLERANPPVDVVATAPECQAILEFINRNNNAKYPKVGFIVGDLNLLISRASGRARFPGSINVVRQQRPTDNFGDFLGRIHTDGSFECHRSVSTEDRSEIIGALNDIAANPSEMAKEYSRQTGSCSFCFLPLNDPKSLLVGYGPVCAKNYKLPRGKS
jgi:hypothetical protein